MKMLLTADRIRSALDDARTEKDVELSLRAHKIKFSYDTSAGFMAFRIPARSGVVLVYRTASRSAPFMVRAAVPAAAPAFPVVPVFRPEY
jgi:hypothetical protein